VCKPTHRGRRQLHLPSKPCCHFAAPCNGVLLSSGLDGCGYGATPYRQSPVLCLKSVSRALLSGCSRTGPDRALGLAVVGFWSFLPTALRTS
ncbi:hypothetical protein V5799_026645, partial [Amblyomma americanum]